MWFDFRSSGKTNAKSNIWRLTRLENEATPPSRGHRAYHILDPEPWSGIQRPLVASVCCRPNTHAHTWGSAVSASMSVKKYFNNNRKLLSLLWKLLMTPGQEHLNEVISSIAYFCLLWPPSPFCWTEEKCVLSQRWVWFLWNIDSSCTGEITV